MDYKETAKKLGSLMKLDIDASRAYGQAIDEIKQNAIRDQLEIFREDHNRHVKDLAAAIRVLGEEPPSETPDIKGYLIEGFTAIRSMTGTEGALKAMRGNEMLTTKTYEEAREWIVSPEIKMILEKNYQDEERHLNYIKQALAEKLWNKAA